MKFIILIFFIFTGISSFSQSRERLKEKTFTPDDFEEFKVEIKPGKKQQPLELNCNSVYFIDGRADTSKLGFALAGSNTEYHRIVFPKAAAGYINEKIIPFFTGGSPDNGGIALFHFY